MLSDFAVSEQTVIKVFLEVNMARNGLKIIPYSGFGVLSTNPYSVSLPDFIRWSWTVAVSELTVTNVFSEANMAPNGLKIIP